MKYTEVCPHCFEKSSGEEKYCPDCGKRKTDVIESFNVDTSEINKGTGFGMFAKVLVWLALMIGAYFNHPMYKNVDACLFGAGMFYFKVKTAREG